MSDSSTYWFFAGGGKKIIWILLFERTVSPESYFMSTNNIQTIASFSIMQFISPRYLDMKLIKSVSLKNSILKLVTLYPYLKGCFWFPEKQLQATIFCHKPFTLLSSCPSFFWNGRKNTKLLQVPPPKKKTQ